MAVYTLINNILLSLNTKILVGGLFCDLQKAFDRVNYDKLLSKMKFYGITDGAGRLMESYLRHRYQGVVINNYSSTWKEVQHGAHKAQYLGHYSF